ncbi:MAG: GGDEF domain-containing protein [Deltaproteobacteria bacterium]|nr:MAG: GGDEF domain-containing protein [Deltaproteobacteria bacterium]
MSVANRGEVHEGYVPTVNDHTRMFPSTGESTDSMQGDPKGSCCKPQLVWLGPGDVCPFRDRSEPPEFSVFAHKVGTPPPPADLYILPDSAAESPEALLKFRETLLFPVLYLVPQSWLGPIVENLEEYDDVTIWGAPSKLLVVRVQRLLHHCKALGATLGQKQEGALGLPMRSVFKASAEYMLNQQCANEPVTCLYMDLDRLKDLNTKFSYSVVDKLLEQWSQTLRSWAPKGALVTRWGGDSFAVILPCDKDAASEKVRQLQEQVANQPFQISMFNGNEHSISLSFCVGLVERSESKVEVEAFVEKARLCCYEQKHQKGIH